jgi:RimJ/RimL family protein N-acetyltransferase
MIEKTDGTHIGDLCFKGLQENGIAEIGYGILEEHQSQGYATEAVQAAKAMTNWLTETQIRNGALTVVQAISL